MSLSLLWRVPLSLVTWVAMLLIRLPLNVVGAVVTLPLAYFDITKTRKSMYFEYDVIVWRPRWAWLFSNEEDGVAAQWYLDRELPKGRPLWLVRWTWSAFRNPSTNFRYTVFGMRFRPEHIRSWGNVGYKPRRPGEWAYVTQGVYSSFRYVFLPSERVMRVVNALRRLFRRAPAKREPVSFWIGWKVNPDDALGVFPGDRRLPRTGFGIQLRS